MITITDRCQTCSWKWKPRKADGPDVDFERAKNAAAVHRRQHPRHLVEAKRVEQHATVGASRIRALYLEIESR